MKFKTGDRVQRDRPDARYTGTVVQDNQHHATYDILWSDGGITTLSYSQVKAAVQRMDPDEELEKMAAATAEKPTASRKGGTSKVAAQKNLTRQLVAGDKPKNLGEGSLQMVSRMDATEKKLLAHCVSIIDKALRMDLEAADALAIIRDKRLYREKYDRFEHFCEAELKLGRQWVDRQIAGAEVIRQIEGAVKAQAETDGAPISLPTVESQVRPLVQLKTAEERSAAYLDAVREAGDKPVTAKYVEAAVAKRLGREVVSRTPAGTNGHIAPVPDSQGAVADAWNPTLPWTTLRITEHNGKTYIVKPNQDREYEFFETDAPILAAVNAAFFLGKAETMVGAVQTAEKFISATSYVPQDSQEAPAE